MLISYAVALPGVIVALFLFPLYHAFPPNPIHRPFWSQASDHYFYVMYSLLVMGASDRLRVDLLFPDLLDIFVPLASSHRQPPSLSRPSPRPRHLPRVVLLGTNAPPA